MNRSTKTFAVFAVIPWTLAFCLGACGHGLGDDDDSTHDLAGLDQSASFPDQSACTQNVFAGFPGTTAVERRLECPCGCLIDSLEDAASNDLWNRATVSSAFANSNAGVVLDVDGGAGAASATLTSTDPGGPFYIEGDFDLRVDYALVTMVPGGSAQLRIDIGGGVFYTVSRARTAAGADQYASTLDGPAASSSTTATTGTLRLLRSGPALTAFGDDNQVSTIKTAATTRVSIDLNGAVSGCPSSHLDGGASDGGDGCAMSTTLHNVRLVTGALVDRL